MNINIIHVDRLDYTHIILCVSFNFNLFYFIFYVSLLHVSQWVNTVHFETETKGNCFFLYHRLIINRIIIKDVFVCEEKA